MAEYPAFESEITSLGAITVTQIFLARFRNGNSWKNTSFALAGVACWIVWGLWFAPHNLVSFFISILVLIAVVLFFLSRDRREWRKAAQVDPILLAAPFDGVWRVRTAGPNRKFRVPAFGQRFAYEFVRVAGQTFGSGIVSPVEGTVVLVRDDVLDSADAPRLYPEWPGFGNAVAIQSNRGVVFLGNLQAGSIAVRIGDRVAIGDRIGACGRNSDGKSQLHLHVQRDLIDAPLQDPGIPIAFWDGKQRYTLSDGDRLTRGDVSATPGLAAAV
jgi:murein DD-endopeptidase MepM/ murein hydrolase activator NlpD